MLKRISDTPISLRLLFTFAWATIIPFIVIITLSSFYFQEINAGKKAVQISNQTIKITTNELAHLQSMHALLVALLPSVTLNSTSNANVNQAEQQVIFQVLSIEGSFDVDSVKYQEQYELGTSQTMAGIRQILVDNNPHTAVIRDQRTLLNQILEHQWPQYKAAQDNVLVGLDTTLPLAEAANLLQIADSLYTPLLESWQRVVDIAQQVNTEVVQVGPTQSNPMLIGTLIAFVTSMAIVFTIGYLVNRTITRPLQHLIGLTRHISKGDSTARASLKRNDEIGQVATSMNTMLDTIVQLMQDTQGQSDVLQTRVEKLISEVRGVGEGNLRTRAEVTADVLGSLASSFNYMISQLESLVMRIKKVAREVEFSTAQTLEQINRLRQIEDVQIQHASMAVGGVEQMAQASQEVAQRAQILQSIANNAQRSAVGGREATLQAISEIGRVHTNVQATAHNIRTLSERSREINDIVESIFNLAHQTNRLALDSAIQSAVAGEDRNQFGSVVVSIRRLAEQTKNEASRIARIIRNIQEDIVDAAASLEETQRETSVQTRATQNVERALESIFAMVERQARDITDITNMVRQQLQLSTAIAQTIQHVRDMTQQNKAQVSDVAEYIQHQAERVQLLNTSVGAFRVLDN